MILQVGLGARRAGLEVLPLGVRPKPQVLRTFLNKTGFPLPPLMGPLQLTPRATRQSASWTTQASCYFLPWRVVRMTVVALV